MSFVYCLLITRAYTHDMQSTWEEKRQSVVYAIDDAINETSCHISSSESMYGTPVRFVILSMTEISLSEADLGKKLTPDDACSYYRVIVLTETAMIGEEFEILRFIVARREEREGVICSSHLEEWPEAYERTHRNAVRVNMSERRMYGMWELIGKHLLVKCVGNGEKGRHGPQCSHKQILTKDGGYIVSSYDPHICPYVSLHMTGQKVKEHGASVWRDVFKCVWCDAEHNSHEISFRWYHFVRIDSRERTPPSLYHAPPPQVIDLEEEKGEEESDEEEDDDEGGSVDCTSEEDEEDDEGCSDDEMPAESYPPNSSIELSPLYDCDLDTNTFPKANACKKRKRDLPDRN